MDLFQRNWSIFLPRIKSNLGILTITGFGLAIFLFGLNKSDSLNELPGKLRCIYAGLTLMIPPVFIILFISWPPKMIRTKKKLGKVLEISDLLSLHPKVLRIGIVGLSSVGKTSLSDNIIQKRYSKKRTQITTAYICSTRRHPEKYFALMDGPGNNTAQQFDIIQHSDIIIILLDHNQHENRLDIDDKRLQENSAQNNQFRNLFSQSNLKLEQIHVVLNKKDLWSQLNASEVEKLLEWNSEEVKRWKDGNFAKIVTESRHSNINSNDTVELLENLDL